MENIFSKRLYTIRKMNGWSLQDFADRIGLTKQVLSKYEKGDTIPNSTTLINISDVLKISPNFLFSNNMIETELKSIKFRNEKKTDKINQIKLNILKYVEDYLYVEKIAEESVVFENPIKDIEIKSDIDIENVTKFLRKKWKLGIAPINNIISTLEEKGIKVFKSEKDLLDDGVSAFLGKMPVIAYNSRIYEITRIRFTILHELGHILLNVDEEKFDGETIEKFCNSFAGAMLLPEEFMVKIFKNRKDFYLKELVDIKEEYGVSIEALLVRAATLKLASWGLYKSYKEMDKDCEYTGKYLGLEEPSRYMSLLLKILRQNLITPNKAHELYGVDDKIIQSIRDNTLINLCDDNEVYN